MSNGGNVPGLPQRTVSPKYSDNYSDRGRLHSGQPATAACYRRSCNDSHRYKTETQVIHDGLKPTPVYQWIQINGLLSTRCNSRTVTAEPRSRLNHKDSFLFVLFFLRVAAENQIICDIIVIHLAETVWGETFELAAPCLLWSNSFSTRLFCPLE